MQWAMHARSRLLRQKSAIASLKGADVVETLVDNEIAVEKSGKKMADQKGYKTTSEKLEEGKYRVCIIVENVVDNVWKKKTETGGKFCDCTPGKESNKVVVIRSSVMGEGDPELGKVLLKGFIYAISQQKDLPKTMLFYNGGAFITCEGSQSLEDLKALEEQGVKILTCGTCLNHYGLTDRLAVGEVTNMYEIAEKMTQASLIVSP